MRAPAARLLPLLLLVGCSSATAATGLPPPLGARPGGTLRVGLTAPAAVDPALDTEPSADLVVRTMCDTLLTTDPATGRLRPGLAASWLVTDGGLKVVLQLRKDLRFSDGTPLTAEDVKYSLSRLASAAFASPVAGRLRLVAGYPEVHGDTVTDNDRDRRLLSGVAAADPHTLEIVLSQPFGAFARTLADPVTAPVSRRAAERDPQGFSRQPVCAGPYRLDRPYRTGDRQLSLVRSAAYRATVPGLTRGGAGYADRIDVRLYPTAAAAAAAQVGGAVDVAPARPKDSQRVVEAPDGRLEYVGLATGTGAFGRAEVRRALSLALSRRDLVADVFPGTRVPARGFVPAGTGEGRPCADVPPDGDVPAALALLRRAGVSLRGVRTSLAFNDEFRNKDLAYAVARQWYRAFGLVAVPTPLTYQEFLARGTGQRGFEGAFRYSWEGRDVDDYLRPLFGTDGILRDNFARFSDPEVDDTLSRRAAKATDPADRSLAYRKVADLVCAAMPMIPLTEGLSRWLLAPSVGSAATSFVDTSSGRPLLREAFLR